MFVLRNRNDSQQSLSEANFHARLGHTKQLLKNIDSVILDNFVHWRKDIYTDHTDKPIEWPTSERTSINQEERRREKASACTIYVQSLTASVGEWQVVDVTQLFVDHLV